MNKLSHSAASKFQSCPREYYFHYVEKLRPRYTSSALLFGSAVDKAFEALVQGKDPYAEFDKVWTFQEVNKRLCHLLDCTLIVYSDSEFDEDILTDLQKKKIKEYLNQPEIDEMIYFYNIKEEKKKVGYKNLSETKQKFYNAVNWYCLERKGHLMIDALKEKVLPRLGTILATQKKIELSNGEDRIEGFSDLVCLFEGDIVVFDLKTSSVAYEEDAVLTSAQLSLYVHALYGEYKTRKAGFIVLNKRIIKNKTKFCSKCLHNGTGSRARTCDKEINGVRCHGEWKESFSPEAGVQFILGEIPKTTENIVLENLDDINKMIKNGIFTRNLSNCSRAWGKCAYYDLCYKNDSKDLEKIE